jgi:hypothetical protein
MTAVCDTSYQLLTVWGLRESGFLQEAPEIVLSIGDERLRGRADAIASALGTTHHHVAFPDRPLARLRASRRLVRELPPDVRDRLAHAERLLVFNDAHPATVAIRRACRRADTVLIEEGIGVHRTRPMRAFDRWLGRLVAPGLNTSGRQGEAAWVDELWVSQTDTLTPAQRRARVKSFDRAALLETMRRRWRVSAALAGEGPVLLFVGQPFVEDGVLTADQRRRVHAEVRAALAPDLVARVSAAYKPHPRETGPEQSARELFAEDVVLLDRDLPLEVMDLGDRPVMVVAMTSGSLRGVPAFWRCVSIAHCFPWLTGEAGSATIFPGVRFIDRIESLGEELRRFLQQADAGEMMAGQR